MPHVAAVWDVARRTVDDGAILLALFAVCWACSRLLVSQHRQT